MDYRKLKWHDLRSFATAQGVDTRKKKKKAILEELDSIFPIVLDSTVKSGFNDFMKDVDKRSLKPFKGVKETHPLFEELEEYIPHLKAFLKMGSVSSIDKVNTAIATLFMKYIEEDKSAAINLGCGRCKHRYYERMIAGYNRLAVTYDRECIVNED